MIIPSEFKIGRYTYKVVMKKRINKSGTCWGRAYVHDRIIHLATHIPKRALTEAEITTTFWHEVMHCVLYDMGHALWKDEAFVSAVSENLFRIISTVKFKD
ncbi:hypothetical protein UFOVP228_10 [uncultured Caudovirales phage]|uniref:SprT-like n=1 Tax=uncultured Caudovirales phage TaxID=2100421 RepID=A0A6J5T8Y5_9CAUD|nr:hypothetical protein UFOVP47_92 [uncultured Caudovirales phage]CAB5218941.1 hypothetical protein UFOVP228_10 [uncultured Caudovirales phage]